MNILNKLQIILHIPRYNLGILAASKGWISGLIKIKESYSSTSDINHTTTITTSTTTTSTNNNYISLKNGIVRSIPSDIVMNPINIQNDGAQFILVVEKECIFRRLVEDKIWYSNLPCIILTGCGFPDFATRAFLSQLYTQLKLPIYGLSDWNPYGLGIMLCYMNNMISKVIPSSSSSSLTLVSSSTTKTNKRSRQTHTTNNNNSSYYDMDDLDDLGTNINSYDNNDDEDEEWNTMNTNNTFTSDTAQNNTRNRPILPIEWLGLRYQHIEK